MNDSVEEMKAENAKLKDEIAKLRDRVIDVQSRTMGTNLIFYNTEELKITKIKKTSLQARKF